MIGAGGRGTRGGGGRGDCPGHHVGARARHADGQAARGGRGLRRGARGVRGGPAARQRLLAAGRGGHTRQGTA